MMIFNLFPKRERVPGKLIKRVGLKKDKEDSRDYVISSTNSKESSFLDINPYSYVKDQGSWNSCLSHAIATSLEIMHTIQKTKYNGIELSERYVYYKTRELIEQLPNNVGSSMRDGLKALKNNGASPERLCPYISSEMNKKPGFMAESFANWWKISSYWRCKDLTTIKKMIELNYPVVLGVYTTSNFMHNTEEIIYKKEDRIFGGHAIVVYGYDSENLFCINSWGKKYKDKGTMKIPNEYITNYFIDAWTVEL